MRRLRDFEDSSEPSLIAKTVRPGSNRRVPRFARLVLAALIGILVVAGILLLLLYNGGSEISTEDESQRLAHRTQRRNDDNDVPLRWKASNRSIPGLTVAEEGNWTEPFFFVHGADSQLGLIDEMNNVANPSWEEELRRLDAVVTHLNAMRPKPKFFIICGDLVNAYPGRYPDRFHRQSRDFKTVLQRLHPDIPAICVCGNHDIGNRPTNATIATYRGAFGDDYFVFWAGGTKFVVLNSQYYKNPVDVRELAAAQDAWLDGVLTAGGVASPKQIVVFLHIPPFKSSEDEEEAWYNLGLEARRSLLKKLYDAGVRRVFCGHFHQNAGGTAFAGKMEIVVTSAIGRVWAGKPGVRIVKVYENFVEHKYFDIPDIPAKVEL